MRSLQNIFSSEDVVLGISDASSNHNAGYKLITSPNTGERKVIPSYITDYTFQNDKRKKQLRLATLTQDNWNWSRNRVRHRVMVDRTHSSVAQFDKHAEEIPSE